MGYMLFWIILCHSNNCRAVGSNGPDWQSRLRWLPSPGHTARGLQTDDEPIQKTCHGKYRPTHNTIYFTVYIITQVLLTYNFVTIYDNASPGLRSRLRTRVSICVKKRAGPLKGNVNLQQTAGRWLGSEGAVSPPAGSEVKARELSTF